MAQDTGNQTTHTVAHFRERGWMRVAQAIDPHAAAAMRDLVWQALARLGVERDKPSTWTTERPAHLQSLKHDPVFRAVGSEALRAAIAAVFEGRRYADPDNWGALFVAFPGQAKWEIPASGWHLDAYYGSPLWPAGGVKTFALLGDVVPRGGGTLILGGSHRLVHRWFQQHPPPPGTRSADMRKRLQTHPYIRDLHTPGDRDQRVDRFMERAEVLGGIPLQVVETTGAAGDVILAHPLTLHVAAPNNAEEPRFLLSGGITTDGWGWSARECPATEGDRQPAGSDPSRPTIAPALRRRGGPRPRGRSAPK